MKLPCWKGPFWQVNWGIVLQLWLGRAVADIRRKAVARSMECFMLLLRDVGDYQELR